MDIPEPARKLLEARFEGEDWTLMHAWISEETVLCVCAIAGEGAIDADDEGVLDVDAVRIEALQLFSEGTADWTLSEDGAFSMADVFGDLLGDTHDHEDAHDPGPPLES